LQSNTVDEGKETVTTGEGGGSEGYVKRRSNQKKKKGLDYPRGEWKLEGEKKENLTL